MLTDTQDATRDSRRLETQQRPGVVLVYSGATPAFRPFALDDKSPLLLGREGPLGAVLTDERVSRQHAEISVTGEGWWVRDCGSRNGTFVDGVQVQGELLAPSPRVIRVGETVLVRSDDIDNVHFPGTGGTVIGSKLHRAFTEIDRAARTSETLLILGESGTGKELAASRYHQRGPNAGGPFVAVNCAAIPEQLAERLLFGAKRGAYSGATVDSVGHVQSADFGVLFLDEGGELDLQVQAKLLRVLETREVVPLGASHGVRVAIRVCVATHRDLRAAVTASRFRADLYHRLAPPEVTLPPLRDRLDEITQHVVAAIHSVSPVLKPQAKLVEACLLRHWPGNVRELRKHLHAAASRAASEGGERVRLDHLSPTAGEALQIDAPRAPSEAPPPPAAAAPQPKARRDYVRWSQSLTREQLEKVLAEHSGNVALAARSMGMARSQMYREMARFSLRRPSGDED